MASASVPLLLGAAAVAVLHSILPDHWVPLAVVGRTQRWSLFRVARVSALASAGHVVASVVLAGIIAAIGLQFQRQLETQHRDRRRGLHWLLGRGEVPSQPTISAPPSVGVIMVVAAHPDDIESWCAGTLARSIDAGATVRLLLVTSGDKGSDDPRDSAADVALRREREAMDAGRRLGLAEVAFLRHPDGEVEDTRALRGELVAAIRRWRPAALFTHDPAHPYPPYLTHRDHRVVGRAVLDAAYPLARDRLSFPEHAAEGLAPHAVREVWLFSTDRPTAHVDIGAGFDRKIAARLAHVSQTRDADALRAGWRERAAQIGAEAGLPLAESFAVLHLD